MTSKWVSLQNHSYFSILNGVRSPKDIVEAAAARNMSALSLTDLGVMHGAINFFEHAKQKGIKPLLGMDAYIIYPNLNDSNVGRRDAFVRVTLLAKNTEGYRQICKLSSSGFLEKNFYYVPRVEWKSIQECKGNIVLMSAGIDGPVGHAFLYKNKDFAEDILIDMHQCFGEDFYFSLNRNSDKFIGDGESTIDKPKELACKIFEDNQREFNKWAVPFCRNSKINIVATNDVFFIDEKEWLIRDMLLNISSGIPLMSVDETGKQIPNAKRKMASSLQNFLKTDDEILPLFSDIPEAIENTKLIADKCNVDIDLSSKHYPVYHPQGKAHTTEQERIKCVEEEMIDKCNKAIPTKYKGKVLDRLKEYLKGEDAFEVIKERIEFEFKILSSRGLCDYIMIVHDFIEWSKKNDIPIGPGRGSGVGSIILYLLSITDLDPLSLGLFFERFINPERPSYPDIDVDVCMERRGDVIDYLVSKYGKDSVAHIVTYGTLKSKMALRDVGRALSISIKEVNRIVGMIPDKLGITIDDAINSSEDLEREYNDNPEIKSLIDYGKRLEGCVRNVGLHAAGILISGNKLEKNIPVFKTKDANMLVSQFSMYDAEKAGMLKMDVLGLRTLTIIKRAIRRIKEAFGDDICLDDIDIKDESTYEFFQTGKTTGVFQMESAGMQDLLKQFKPKKFSDIIAIVSLYRPGPMDMIPSFIDRKNGREPIDYYHEDIKSILEDTYGIMVYQEQVMHIAEVIAGYSKGEGDILRRAMGKKNLEVMNEQRDIFSRRAEKKGYAKELAITLFDKMAKFAAYGFNKSHAAAYAKISFVTAYLKNKYSGIWTESMLTESFSDREKSLTVLADAKSMNLVMKCPDINQSEATRFNNIDKDIMFPFSGIKGIGSPISKHIYETRQIGEFTSLIDFLHRVNDSEIKKKAIQILVLAGAFDKFGCRKEQYDWIESNYDRITKIKKMKQDGELFLFDEEEPCKKDDILTGSKDKSIKDLMIEKELLCTFVSGNPMQMISKKIMEKGYKIFELSDFLKNDKIMKCMTVVFIEGIKIMQRDIGKHSSAKCQISDGSTLFTIFLKTQEFKDLNKPVKEGQMCVMFLRKRKRKDSDEYRLSAKLMEIIDEKSELSSAMMFKINKEIESNSPYRREGKLQETNVLKIDISKIKMSTLLKMKEAMHKHEGNVQIKISVVDGCNNKEVYRFSKNCSPEFIQFFESLKSKYAGFLSN